jgi:hypothetical protein
MHVIFRLSKVKHEEEKKVKNNIINETRALTHFVFVFIFIFCSVVGIRVKFEIVRLFFFVILYVIWQSIVYSKIIN